MGFFDFLHTPDINQGVKEYQSVPGAVLLDVRTPEEYWEGRIHGSVNVPLQTIEKVDPLPKIKMLLCLSTATPVPGAVRQSVYCSIWDMPM